MKRILTLCLLLALLIPALSCAEDSVIINKIRGDQPDFAFAEDAKLVLVHLAPSLHKSHAETEVIAAADGLTVAYDGMELEI